MTPISPPTFSDPSSHITLLTEEPILTVTLLTIASRYRQMPGTGGHCRSHAIPDQLWNYLRGMIERCLWGQEAFGGGFCGSGGSSALIMEETDTSSTAPWRGMRKGSLRTLGTIESLLILTEWHPRALHFPPQEATDELMLPESISRLAEEERGIILLTGTTGSGKSTTLAAMVDHINSSKPCHIVTIEDPIEVLHQDKLAIINQREVRIDTTDFATGMRAAMRQDPDVILVGEMRDHETVKAALGAAATGHFVMSTLHTTDAAETIIRVIDFFPPHEQKQVRLALAGALRGIVCQRLVPRADGQGRCVVMEIALGTGRIADAIVDPDKTGSIPELVAEGAYYGMQTFDQHLVALVRDGIVDLSDAMSVSSHPHDLTVGLRRLGIVA